MSDALVSILLTPDALAEIEASKVEAASLAMLPSLPTDETLYGALLGQIQTKLAQIEKVRQTIAKPMTEAKRAIDNLFNAASKPYEDAKDLIKGRLAALATERLRLEREVREAHAKALAAASPTEVLALPAPAPVAQPALANASVAYAWDWDLLDIAMVPPEYLALNPATMKGYVARYKNSETIPEIPGIAFKRIAKITARQG